MRRGRRVAASAERYLQTDNRMDRRPTAVRATLQNDRDRLQKHQDPKLHVRPYLRRGGLTLQTAVQGRGSKMTPILQSQTGAQPAQVSQFRAAHAAAPEAYP